MILTISLYMHMYVRSLIGIDISISSAVFLLKKCEKFTDWLEMIIWTFGPGELKIRKKQMSYVANGPLDLILMSGSVCQ